MRLFIERPLWAEGNEIAHIDLLRSATRDGPVGNGVQANALARQSEGH